MKKLIFAAIISLFTVFCVSATVASIPADNFTSSVTATIAGGDEDIDLDTRTLVTIYNLMPQKVKDLCYASYRDIAPRVEQSGSTGFVYEGVSIVPVRTDDGIDLEFKAQGHKIVVKNYTRQEFDSIFGI